MRLDLYLSENKMAKSREYAKNLIIEKSVSVNGRIISKPSFNVNENDEIVILSELHNYVGRGGLKLEHALNQFNLNIIGKVCLDIGASTGGFTDCMLQNGAKLVYAVDVGHDQLATSLILSEKVINMEKTNIKLLKSSDFSNPVEFIAMDVSFVSITQILPKIKELLINNQYAVVLIKPQFEAGKSDVGKNGIVKNRKVHIRVLNEIYSHCCQTGLKISDVVYSPISGGDGNIEYLACIEHSNGCSVLFDFDKITSDAFNSLKK